MPGPQKLLIRTDANSRIGWGHFMRCLAVAQSWKEQGGYVHFICCDSDPGIQQRLIDSSISYDFCKSQPSGLADLAFVRKWVDQYTPNWLLLDHYAFTPDYVLQLQGSSHRIAAFDDGWGERALPVDLVINGNLHAIRSAVTYNQPIQLLGPRFMALREEVIGKANSDGKWVDERADGEATGNNHTERKRLLVTLGGAATEELLKQILVAIFNTPGNFFGWEVRLLLGSLGREVQNSLRRQLLDCGLNGDCLTNVFQVGNEYQQADLAISAGGSTLYELSFHSVPTVVITTAENQSGSVQAMVDAGMIRSVTHPTLDNGDSLTQNLNELISDAALRRNMMLANKGLIDGRGATRIARRMAGEPQLLRPARLTDAKNLLTLRNDPTVRSVSLSSAIVSPTEHLRWLTAKLADAHSQLLVVEARSAAGETQFLGQIRFDWDNLFTEATISIALVHDVRGRGIAPRLIAMACREMWTMKPQIKRFVALIRNENQASLKAFENAGFRNRNEFVVDGIACRRLICEANECVSSTRTEDSILLPLRQSA